MARSLDEILNADALASARAPFEKATTLPAGAFTSAEVYEREAERLFAGGWLCAGRTDQVAQAGDYLCLDLLGEKLVLVRDGDRDGTVRVLSRVCRHRAAELVRGAGNTRSFQCPYHAWTYRLDGSLVGAPHMEGATGFDRASCRLPEIRSEVWEGFVFVNLDGRAEPLGPQLAPLSESLAGYRMSELVTLETGTYDSPFNWKVLVDNFMEAYHHIATHKDTLEPIYPGALSSSPDPQGPYSLLLMPEGPTVPRHPGPLPHLPGLAEEDRHRLVAAVVYPFHLFAPGAHFVTWYQLLPHGGDRFTLRIFTCLPAEIRDDPRYREAIEGAQRITRVVHEQDIGACEAVWSGLHSPRFESGPLAPLERPLWQFNQWWTRHMLGDRVG